jgi:nucleotide-binding universal stress UspA family protein
MGVNYDRILVPYDGSKFSEKAVNEAVKLAKKFDSDLYLLVAVDRATPSISLTSIDTVGQKKFEKYLEELIPKIDLILRDEVMRCKEQGVCADYEIIEGSPANTILKFAKKRKMDLIVMGSQGFSGIHKLKILGSVSRKVSELADCPVLLVR